MTRGPNAFELVAVRVLRRLNPLHRGGVLTSGQQVLSIESDRLTIGRDETCDVVLDDAFVSRKHACLTVSDAGVLIEDLYSTNGVFVNEVRIERDHVLMDGDRIVLGKHGFTAFASAPASDARAVRTGLDAEPTGTKPPTSTLPTRRAGLFSAVGPNIDGLLDARRVADAARILEGALSTLRDGLRAGLDVPDEAVDVGSCLALRLAAASGDGRWIDRVVELHQRARRAMSAAVIDALPPALAAVADYDVALFRLYFDRLRPMEHGLGVEQFDQLRRLSVVLEPAVEMQGDADNPI